MQEVQSRDSSPCGVTRKVLADEMYEDLNACGQPSARTTKRNPGRGALSGGCPERPCPEAGVWTLHRSAESNYLCRYSLRSKDNWGLTSCRLSSWAMLNICYHDGKQTSLQGFEGQMTECIWKGFERCKLLPRCKGDIKFDSFVVAVTSSSDFFVSHFCFLLRVFPKF